MNARSFPVRNAMVVNTRLSVVAISALPYPESIQAILICGDSGHLTWATTMEHYLTHSFVAHVMFMSKNNAGLGSANLKMGTMIFVHPPGRNRDCGSVPSVSHCHEICVCRGPMLNCTSLLKISGFQFSQANLESYKLRRIIFYSRTRRHQQ